METKTQKQKIEALNVCGKCGEINPDLMDDESGKYHDGCGSDDLLVTDRYEEAVKLSSEIKRERKATIRTVKGEAKFCCIELEDSDGNWYNGYNTRDGFWVLHKGRVHEVYMIEDGGN